MTQILLKTTAVESMAKNAFDITEIRKLSLDSNNVNHDIGIDKNTNVYSGAVRRFVRRWRRAYNGEFRSKDAASINSSTTGTIDGASIKSSMLYNVPRLATPDTDWTSETASIQQNCLALEKPTSQPPSIKGEVENSATAKAQLIIDSILRIHCTLANMSCLKPCPEINALFSELVGIAIGINPQEVTDLVMSNYEIISVLANLRSMASEAESHLEAHWANHTNTSHTQRPHSQVFPATIPYCVIGNSFDKTYTTLRAFPYYQNYIDLANMELSAITPLLPKDKALQKVAFIGSGPLPLTSICLAQILREMDSTSSDTKLHILNIDSSPHAISQSSSLCSLLGPYTTGLTFACEKAGSSSRDLTSYDVVFLAALVGNTQEEKEEVLLRVVKQMRPGALVVVRTSHGLRRLLYPEFEMATEKILEKVQVEVVVHPWGWGGVVNSVIVGRIR